MTIFAYGQTGAGKTFTMEGYKYGKSSQGVPVPIMDSELDSVGLVPRAIHQLFEIIKVKNSLNEKKVNVYCSYLQIYKEKIYDLLNKSQLKQVFTDGNGLKLKWTKND